MVGKNVPEFFWDGEGHILDQILGRFGLIVSELMLRVNTIVLADQAVTYG